MKPRFEHFHYSEKPHSGFERHQLWILLAQQEDLQCNIIGFPEVWEHFYAAVIKPSVRRYYTLGLEIDIWESEHEAENTFISALMNLETLHAAWDRAQTIAHDPAVGYEIIKDFRARARSLVTEFAKFSPREVLRAKLIKVLRDKEQSIFCEISERIFAPLNGQCMPGHYEPSVSGVELATRFTPRKATQKHKNFPDHLPTREQIRKLLLEAFELIRTQLDIEQLHDFVSAVFRVPWKSEFANVSPTGEPEENDDDRPTGVVPVADDIVEVDFADAPEFVGQEVERVIEFRDGCRITSGDGRFGMYFRGYWLWSTEFREDGRELDIIAFGREHGLEKSAAYQWREDFEAMMHAALDPLIREHGHGTIRLALHGLRRKWAPFRP